MFFFDRENGVQCRNRPIIIAGKNGISASYILFFVKNEINLRAMKRRDGLPVHDMNICAKHEHRQQKNLRSRRRQLIDMCDKIFLSTTTWLIAIVTAPLKRM